MKPFPDLDEMAAIDGVRSVALVDRQGLLLGSGGEESEELAPYAALLVKRMLDHIGKDIISQWLWTQTETSKGIFALALLPRGVLVVATEKRANLGMVRLRVRQMQEHVTLDEKESEMKMEGGT